MGEVKHFEPRLRAETIRQKRLPTSDVIFVKPSLATTSSSAVVIPFPSLLSEQPENPMGETRNTTGEPDDAATWRGTLVDIATKKQTQFSQDARQVSLSLLDHFAALHSTPENQRAQERLENVVKQLREERIGS